MRKIVIVEGYELQLPEELYLPDEEFEKRMMEAIANDCFDKELKEERKLSIKHFRSNHNPLPKHQQYHKPKWIRTRSNPKLR